MLPINRISLAIKNYLPRTLAKIPQMLRALYWHELENSMAENQANNSVFASLCTQSGPHAIQSV